MSMQFLFANATRARPGLFITLLGEPSLKMMRYQQQYAFFKSAKVGHAVHFLNLTSESLAGDLDVVLHSIEAAIARALVGNTTRTAPSPPVRDTLHRLDGGIAQVEVRAQGFLEDGLPLVHLVIRDITERLAAEALTSELAAQLQATQRLEAVGTLAGGVAHEVNNMLQVILGFGIPLLDDRALEPQALASLSEIITAANHASGINRQLLEFSRHAEHHPLPLWRLKRCSPRRRSISVATPFPPGATARWTSVIPVVAWMPRPAHGSSSRSLPRSRLGVAPGSVWRRLPRLWRRTVDGLPCAARHGARDALHSRC